jgi:putative sigma-54 modulation protein
MQISVTGHHVDISPALREYVTSKIARVQRHFDQLMDVHCILTVEKLAHKAEVVVHFSGGTIFADAILEDMYAAIDAMIDKLDRQIRKQKEKLHDHHAKEAPKGHLT